MKVMGEKKGFAWGDLAEFGHLHSDSITDRKPCFCLEMSLINRQRSGNITMKLAKRLLVLQEEQERN
jgi:hypothetical protein